MTFLRLAMTARVQRSIEAPSGTRTDPILGNSRGELACPDSRPTTGGDDEPGRRAPTSTARNGNARSSTAASRSAAPGSGPRPGRAGSAPPSTSCRPASATCPTTPTSGSRRWSSSCAVPPTLRTPEGERELAEGEMVAFPPGREGAHQLINRGGKAVRFLMLSSKAGADLIEYPDSGKISAQGGEWGTPDAVAYMLARASPARVTSTASRTDRGAAAGWRGPPATRRR